MEYNNIMSKDWVKDMYDMHEKYGVHEWMEKNKDNKELMSKFLEFRLKFLQEELEETRAAALFDRNPEEVVDGLIDLCVVAICTLDAFGVDSHKAWNEILRANMEKEVGVKESRPNPLGLPDLIKPEGWVGPSHRDNHGNLINAV
jgi:predicted HAD superfamily Cof-like phosphohydrolase